MDFEQAIRGRNCSTNRHAWNSKRLPLNDNFATMETNHARIQEQGVEKRVIDGDSGFEREILPQTYPLIASRSTASKLWLFGLFTDENDCVPVSKIRRRVLLS